MGRERGRRTKDVLANVGVVLQHEQQRLSVKCEELSRNLQCDGGEGRGGLVWILLRLVYLFSLGPNSCPFCVEVYDLHSRSRGARRSK